MRLEREIEREFIINFDRSRKIKNTNNKKKRERKTYYYYYHHQIIQILYFKFLYITIYIRLESKFIVIEIVIATIVISNSYIRVIVRAI